ncbi:MAG: hypothetical protein ACREJY_09345, partial [Candidatus Rokuibacteriota bacterium]
AVERAAIVAALARVLGLERDDARIRHLPPEQLKRQIFMATRTLVERRLATGPLVLVVEDLHWADAASIELMGAVADGLADRPNYRPARVLLAADPEAATHRAFGVPAGVVIEDDSKASWAQGTVTMGQMHAALINPTGELPAPENAFVAMDILNKRDGFEPSEVDQQIVAAHGMQLTGHFLIDRSGIVRWRQIEAAERIDDLSKFPSDEEILAAARAL